MILGDFRADGEYVTDREMKEIRIRSNKDFHWLIGDDVDTTSKATNDHSYDRHVAISNNLWRERSSEEEGHHMKPN